MALHDSKRDQAIEDTVKGCESCQFSRPSQAVALLHPLAFPKQAWLRLHIDCAGRFLDKTFLIVINTFSKLFEVHTTASTSPVVTIEKLRSSFATHG